MIPSNPAASATFSHSALAGRLALVTGGGSGIGRATALQLARMGAQVAVVGRHEDGLAETVALVETEQGAARHFVADVREGQEVDQVLTEVLAWAGRIDILVNNAGGQFVSPAEKITPNGFRAVTRLNLDATWYVATQVANRAMIPAGYGKIVSVTMTPQRGMPGMSHSSAARAAVESLTRTWAVEWGRFGIRTAAVAPGIVHTPAWERYGLNAAEVAAVIPLGRLQAADEVAAAIAFLASPAGDYVTGITLVSDGGFDLAGPGAGFRLS
jgi:citronellol/citronellal dehydrogenase